MVLPFSVNALEEEPSYEASLKFYKVDEEWTERFDNGIRKDYWLYDVYLNNLEEEISLNTTVNSGDYVIIAPVVKLKNGKEANAISLNLYVNFDAEIFETQTIRIKNLDTEEYKGPFPISWGNGYIGLNKNIIIFEFNGLENTNLMFENRNDYPIGFVALKIKNNVELGTVTSFEFINENYTNTVVGSIEKGNIIVEHPLVTNNYLLTVGGGVMKSETVREPNNVMASTKIDKIKVYDINRNDEEDYVIGIDPYTTLNELKQSFPNYNDYLKVYDRNGNAVTDPNALIGTEMTLKLEKDGSVLDALKIVVRGDLNFDGRVNKTDGVMLDGYIVKLLSFNKYQLLAADITKDGKVNGADQLSMNNYLVGILKNLN